MADTDPTARDPNQVLLSNDLMRALDQLDVLSRKILAGKLHGERHSKKKGRSVEFADYRPYATGDDLRFIDWNLYARLNRLFLRLFMHEEDLSVSILLDTTASMNWGDPNKFLYGKRLAAALAYIGLANHNRVHLYTLADRVIDQRTNLRGRRPIPELLAFLASQEARGRGNLAEACRQFVLIQRQRGVAILISDFLDKQDPADALRHLSGHLHDGYALQVLAPQETHPETGPIQGDLRLLDCEDEQAVEVSVGPALLKRYRTHLATYCQHLRTQCLKRGIVYLVSDTSVPLETLVLRYLRERHLLG